jgi:hypothetical protein
MAAAAFRVGSGRRSVAAASGPAAEVNQFCSGLNQSESGIWIPDPSDNFWDFGICQDIPGTSLGHPFFKRYPRDIPGISHFYNFQIEISLTYLCCFSDKYCRLRIT